jgi:regulator of replication initiation timing
MNDVAEGIASIVKAVMQANEELHLENEALRMMLRGRGLTRRGIRKEMDEYVRGRTKSRSSTRLLTKACRMLQEILAGMSVKKVLEALPIPPKNKLQ